MSLWTMTDNAGGKPKYANTSEKALIFGIDASEAHAANGRIAHAGWVRVESGTGPVVSINVTAAGSGYANNETLVFTGGNGTGASAKINTNASGNVTSVTVVAGGSGYNTAPTVAANTVGGTGATFAVVLGGRAGRVKTEVLVAGGSMTGDADGGAF